MGFDLLLDAVVGGEYDPRCTRIEVALRAIWLLYLRNKWDLLAESGITKDRFDTLFWAFGERLETEKLRTDQQTLAFLSFVRAWGQDEAITLVAAAVWLVGQYMTRRMKVRAAWYGRTERTTS